MLLAAAFRLPYLLLRGAPAADEVRYYSESLALFNIERHQAYLQLIDFDKVFFLIVTAPFSALIHYLGGSPALAVSLFPFIAGIAFIPLIFRLTEKLAGSGPAFWAGLVWAGLPSTVYYSVYTVPPTFYAYFFVFGCLLYLEYLQSGSRKYLIAAAGVLFSLSKIRIEGLIVFLIFLTVLVIKDRGDKVLPRKIGLDAALVCGVAVTLWVIYHGVSLLIFGTGRGTGYGQLIRTALGYLTLKIDSLFAAKTPGGFTQGSKLSYILDNPRLVALALTAILYDVLKTVFILPFRLIPPLFLPFLGLTFSGMKETGREAKSTVIFMTASLASILVYPVFWFSTSRFAYLVVPVGVFFIARGISSAESLVDTARGAGWRIFNGRRLLSALIMIYLIYLNLPLVATGLRASGHAAKPDYEPVRKWLELNLKDKNAAIMCWDDLAAALGMDFIQFPIKVDRANGKWQPVPVKLADVAGLLAPRQNALVVVSRGQLFDQDIGKGRNDYLRQSVNLNLPFYGDEGLEDMGERNELGSSFFLRDFLPLVQGQQTFPGLKLVATVKASDMAETYYIFASDRLAADLK